MIEVMAPRDAHARLLADPGLTLVDVRTVGEFAQGRPLGNVINVPVAFRHPASGELIDNKDFSHIVATLLGEPAFVLVGGADDARVNQAAQLLEAAGFKAIGAVAGGMDAWREALLPTTRDNRDGVSYVSLLTRVRRPGKDEKKVHAAH